MYDYAILQFVGNRSIKMKGNPEIFLDKQRLIRGIVSTLSRDVSSHLTRDLSLSRFSFVSQIRQTDVFIQA